MVVARVLENIMGGGHVFHGQRVTIL